MHNRKSNDLWIDYVAGTGDGWNPTYSIASALAAPRLSFQSLRSDEPESTFETRRGDILILGGDLSHPRPEEYEERLIFPFETAFPSGGNSVHDVFALPGARDRRDGLSNFSRVFCSKRPFAGWQSSQDNSYFALKLPYGWWLLGTDFPIYGNIDKQQAEYFEELSARISDSDRVILCVTQPHWIYAKMYEPFTGVNENNLAIFESRILKKRISVFIANGFHYYGRHATAEGTQKITSGGGGAFLHPTHAANISHLPGGFELQKLYPEKRVSRRLGWRLLLFPLLNPSFGIICASAYLLTSGFLRTNNGKYGVNELWSALKLTLSTVIASPSIFPWFMLGFFVFVLFTETHSKPFRMIAGSLHGLAHFVAAFFVGWMSSYISVSLLHPMLGYFIRFSFMSPGQLLFSNMFSFVFGWIVGPLIVGIYLFISLNVFGRHGNEAFAALAIPDWKHFIRLKIDSDGTLTIFPIGIERVARRWKLAPEAVFPALIPNDPHATQPELIEPPILISRFPTAR